MSSGVFVRGAARADTEAALHVLHRSITALCVADHRDDPQTLAHWLGNKTPAWFERWLDDPASALLVAELEGTVRGVGKVTRAGTLELCYVEPGFERRLVGSSLLWALEARARGFGLTRLHLNSSVAACSFYERHGYQSAGPPAQWLGAVRSFPFVKDLVTPSGT
jgi:GNAT superfamily N-acetyltransferase